MKSNNKIQPVQAPAADRHAAGVTLIELLVLVAIAALVAWILMPRFSSGSEHRSNIHEAKAQMSTISTALELFKLDNGYLPAGTNGLNDLVLKPNGVTNWHQYMESVPTDPWGHPYSYKYSGKNSFPEYKIVSAGPDGKFGTQDDIHN